MGQNGAVLKKVVEADSMEMFQVSSYQNFWFEVRTAWKNKTEQDRWLLSGQLLLRNGILCPYLTQSKPSL